jgi:hypothetical protein
MLWPCHAYILAADVVRLSAHLDVLTPAVRSAAWKDGYGVEVIELAAVLAILNGEPHDA